MKKLLLLLALVFVVFTLVVLSQQNEDAPSADETETQGVLNSLGELLEVIFFPHQTSDDIRASSSPLQFDASECSRIPLITESVRVEFAGYELEFPCTANANGNIYIRQEDGQEEQFRYTLYLGVNIWDGNGTIWSDRIVDNDLESAEPFVLLLRSEGKPKSSSFFEDIDNYSLVKSEEQAGLDIYRRNDSQRAIGVLKNHLDNSGQQPRVSCSLIGLGPTGLEDIFKDSHDTKFRSLPCSAGWNLTHDITISILRLRPDLAYDFEKIFQTIQPEIQKIIISRPNQTP